LAEVGKTCPKCGTFFTGNKCPKCGYEILPRISRSIIKKKDKGEIKGIYR
jgi:RNA polymerase subunit RPABC4/transcription elongation factor Spt4